MSKPYGANSIYELKQLTVNQGTGQCLVFFFTILLMFLLAVHVFMVGEDQILKYFNDLFSLRLGSLSSVGRAEGSRSAWVLIGIPLGGASTGGVSG